MERILFDARLVRSLFEARESHKESRVVAWFTR